MLNSGTFKVEIVTPAFPGGAELPKDSDDFEGVRPTSIVYGLRWWFRALAGAVLGADALPDVRHAESLVFGTPHEIGPHKNGLRSRVRLAVVQNVRIDRCLRFEERDFALKYLAYGLYPTDRSTWRRRFIPPGETFEFELRVAPLKGGPEIPFELVEMIGRLWIEFGGFGSRWRHGLGGMREASVALPDAASFGLQAAKRVSQARQRMGDFLATLNLPASTAARERTLPAFPIAVDPYFKMAWRDDAGQDWRQALKTSYLIWRNGRLMNPADPRTSTWNAGLYAAFMRRQDLRGQRAQLAGLGLPIPFGFPQGAAGISPRSNGVLEPEESDRRASPVWLRLVKVSRGSQTRYGMLALLWRSQFLPVGEQAQLREGSKDGRTETVPFDPNDAEQWFDGYLTQPANHFRRV